MLERLTANRVGMARLVTREGWDYLVAPMTLLVPGVLNGSDGALLYPPAEVARTAGAWDGVPLTVGHPTRDGRNLSARTPGVTPLGRVRNAAFRGGKLVAEGWFDVQQLRRQAPRLLAALEDGRKVEPPTGLFTDNHPVNFGHRDSRGRAYSAVARNYRPDHVAVLLGERGACSLLDGCGVNNREREDAMRRIVLNYRADEDDVLTVPTMNFSEIAREERATRNAAHQGNPVPPGQLDAIQQMTRDEEYTRRENARRVGMAVETSDRQWVEEEMMRRIGLGMPAMADDEDTDDE
jgi:hypothetical protein